MPTFHNLGSNQPYFKNQFWTENFLTDARVYNIIEKENKSFKGVERLGGDRKGVRLAIKNKVPQYSKGSDWPNIKEKRTIKKLVRRYEVHGERTGTRRGRLFFEVWDIDITHLSQNLPAWLQKQIRTNFELVAKIYRFSYVKTKNGYQVYLLLEELSPNCEIFHRDSWKGVKRNIGSILSKGRQVEGVSGQFKEWVQNGSWFWKLKNVEELTTILKKFFFEVDLKVNVKEKPAQKQISSINTSENQKVSESLKEVSQNISKNPYKLFKLENIRVISKQTTKRANHYRINYLDKYQNTGFFFMDSYFRDKKELIQPNLVGSFLLSRGYKYQFFSRFLTL